MNKQDLFELYKKVQNKDKEAEDLLIQEHKKHFPNNYYHKNNFTRSTDSSYRESLHMMYLHLSRKMKK